MATLSFGSRTVLPNGSVVFDGSGSPEGSVTAPAGSFYLRTNGQAYQKVSGSGNTGWYTVVPIAVGTSAPSDTSIIWLDTN